MNKFIHCMYENEFFIKDDIIYDTTDGCIKQYRCENEMWLLSAFYFTQKVIIYRCINATDHVRTKYMLLMEPKRNT